MPNSSANESGDQLLLVSAGFRHWLSENRCSLVFTTYQRGRLFFVGLKTDGNLWAHERFFDQCQGLYADGEQIWLSTLSHLWNLPNSLLDGQVAAENGADRLYSPRRSYVTGAVDVHDIGLSSDRLPLFVNTRFSCLAVPDDRFNFRLVWKPAFITALEPDDRCHLNGMAMQNGAPQFVTAHARSDTAEGWRSSRTGGGIVIAVDQNEIVTDRLSMPHSPRLHDDRLWVLNSGTGEFGHIDLADGRFQPVCFCPGYARGLGFVGHHAVIGVSRTRANRTFQDLPLGESLAANRHEAMAGLVIVNLESGEIEHWLKFEHTVEELYDVSVLPGVRQPAALGLRDPEKLAGFMSICDEDSAFGRADMQATATGQSVSN